MSSRIKLCFISPTEYIDTLGEQGDFHLALSHLIDKDEVNEYERKLVESGKGLILDNGLFENKVPEALDTLIEKAKRIKAKIVFAPDHLYNVEETRRNVDLAWNLVKSTDIGLGVVVQADNEKDYLDFYDELVKDDRVTLIGISILAVPKCFGGPITESRITLLQKLLQRGGNDKPCHLLGLGDSYKDVLFANENCPFVFSNDTSSPIWNAFQGKAILENGSVEGGKTEVKVDFNFNSATTEQFQLAVNNINQIKKLICK